MISVVKEKFNFLASFCIVAFFFIMVAIITSLYMRKKIYKFDNALILSHRNDKFLFFLMLLFTGALIVATLGSQTDGPSGWPQPSKSKWQVQTTFDKTYDIHVDREIIIGQLSEDGWWSLDMVSLYYVDVSKCPKCNQQDTDIDVSIQSYLPGGKFKNTIDNKIYNQTMNVDINNSTGKVHFNGEVPEVV